MKHNFKFYLHAALHTYMYIFHELYYSICMLTCFFLCMFLATACNPCPPSRDEPLKIDQLELFLVVEVSILPKLRLYVQTAPQKYNITRYRIQLIRSLIHDQWVALNYEHTISPNETFFTYIHDSNKRPGIYNFTVQPLHSSCAKGECKISKAPGIVIGNNHNFFIVFILKNDIPVRCSLLQNLYFIF